MNLLLLAADGAETRIDSPRERQVREALGALDPALHVSLRLETGAAHMEVRPVRHAGNSGGTATVCVGRDSEILWLGRARSGDDLVLHGSRLPRLVEVPVTWASNALDSFLDSEVLRSSLPWHDEGFTPLGPWRAEAFAFERLSSSGAGTAELLRGLRKELLHLLRTSSPPGELFSALIAELRRVGHDLWCVSVESNGEGWSRDYMRSVEGQGLFLAFEWGPPIDVVIQFDDATSE